jgi:tRNA-dihydrouridine synthase
MTQHHTELVATIDRFLASAGMSEITLGRKALGDPHFVRQLRNGRRLWPETEAKVRRFMAAHSNNAAA